MSNGIPSEYIIRASVSKAPHGCYIWDFWIMNVHPAVDYYACVRPRYKDHFYKQTIDATDLDKKDNLEAITAQERT